MSFTLENNRKLQTLLLDIATRGIHHSVGGLSQMLGETLSAANVEVQVIPILEIPGFFGSPEEEVVGVYLRAEGKMEGQFMLILPVTKALELVDILMGEEPGTTQDLESMGKSALAEVGNLMGTFFLNEVATLTGLETKPSIPAVMFDMVGAIMNIIVASSAELLENVITIQAGILHGDREGQVYFWFIPHPSALELLASKAK